MKFKSTYHQFYSVLKAKKNGKPRFFANFEPNLNNRLKQTVRNPPVSK